MMKIEENISLKAFNTFGINAISRYFSGFNSRSELEECLLAAVKNGITNKDQILILGGGSNMLFTRDYPGFVLKNQVKGIEVVKQDEQYVYLKAGAGENWHQFVLYCIDHELAGVENLSLIPGNVGASPMQNIGAYGVEIKDVFHELEAFHLEDKSVITFTKEDCHFGYRESIFKKKHKGEFVILSVTFRLNKIPEFKISYGAIEQELEKMTINKLSIQAISTAVINIRSSKLPDPAVIGNAGSFFKNPVITTALFEALRKKYPAIPGYPSAEGVKLAAGWMIEQCGWKGYRSGDAGCHEKQALVLVNYGNATGKEIYALSQLIANSVKEKFKVDLEREVNII
ncbi:MAG: UDP-N-acetylmuramate dehydrogenase [Flavitalea sp.]